MSLYIYMKHAHMCMLIIYIYMYCCFQSITSQLCWQQCRCPGPCFGQQIEKNICLCFLKQTWSFFLSFFKQLWGQVDCSSNLQMVAWGMGRTGGELFWVEWLLWVDMSWPMYLIQMQPDVEKWPSSKKLYLKYWAERGVGWHFKNTRQKLFYFHEKAVRTIASKSYKRL